MKRKTASPRVKYDPMNGHVEMPWFYFLLFLLIAFLSLGLFVLSIYVKMPQPMPSDLVACNTDFRSYDVKNMQRSLSTKLTLYADGFPHPFTLDFFEGYDTWIPDPSTLCDGRVYQVSARVNQESYGIYTITYPDGTPLLTYDDYQQGYQNSQGMAINILMVFSLLSLVFFVFGIVFTRNPNRFPTWVQKLYYKSGMLH